MAAVALAGCSHPGGGGSPNDGATGAGGTQGASGGAGGGGPGTGGAAGARGGAGGGASTGGSSGGGAGGTAGRDGAAGGAPNTGAGGGAPPLTKVPGQGSCSLPPGARFADVQTAYDKWKTDLVTSDGAGGFLRVRRPNSGSPVNSSNSEGTGYGMIAAVYMNDQDLFDKLWKYEQLFLDGNGLMNWEINPQGTAASGTGAATDGDEDMAFALIMADKKWGGKGSLADSYLNYAKKQIDLLWSFEVDHNMGDVLTPGDQFGGGAIINISYFAPAYYRIFGQVSGKTSDWNKVVESSYRVLAATLTAGNGNAGNGLVPAWSTPAGAPMAPAGKPTNHQLDSCRTPFRIAQDSCWFAEPRALDYLQKISGFYAGVGATHLVDAYSLNGAPAPNTGLNLAAFVGPAGVGAMATPAFTTLRDDAYAAVASLTLLGDSLYYNESWTVLSLLMMNGRFIDLTSSSN